MNDRHLTIRRFYRRHHDIHMMELAARVKDWSGEVIYDWQVYVLKKCLSMVRVEKLKGSLKEGSLVKAQDTDE